jgi:predicted membrane protein
MKRWQIVTGVVLILLGIIALLNQVFPDLRIGRFIGPLLLIGLGVFLILRPRIAKQSVIVKIPVLGDVRRTGAWEVTDHEFWWFVGGNRLDFTEAIFPKGEALIKIFGFVTETTIILPEDVGLRLESSAFLTDYKGMRGKQERFLSPLEDQSSNYFAVDKRVNLQTFAFVSEIKVKSSII